ncbi:MAG: hypothetical protein NTU61_03510 [Candidatus Altiarchaeota archaeon]|nr:hypothetical protein [Candidatus Altiarchaeota archaeon]
MRAIVLLAVLALASIAMAYDSSTEFRGIKVTASIYGAKCSGSGFSMECYAKPGDLITLSYTLENTGTVYEEACLMARPSNINIESRSGFSYDSSYNMYCMGEYCNTTSKDECLKSVPNGGKLSARFEFKSPTDARDYNFLTTIYVKTTSGKEESRHSHNFHSVECLSDDDCNGKGCVSYACGGIPTTTTSTTLVPIKYDYDANKTMQENAQSLLQSSREFFDRLPFAAKFFIVFLTGAAILYLADKIIK